MFFLALWLVLLVPPCFPLLPEKAVQFYFASQWILCYKAMNLILCSFINTETCQEFISSLNLQNFI